MKTFVNLTILSSLVLLTGCTKIQYLDEALRLQAYAAEGAAQAKQVAAQDAAFDKLWARITAGDALAELKTGASIRAAFGEPVAVLPARDHEGCVEFLYRYQVKYFNSSKVYFLVNAEDRVLSIRTEHAH